MQDTKDETVKNVESQNKESDKLVEAAKVILASHEKAKAAQAKKSKSAASSYVKKVVVGLVAYFAMGPFGVIGAAVAALGTYVAASSKLTAGARKKIDDFGAKIKGSIEKVSSKIKTAGAKATQFSAYGAKISKDMKDVDAKITNVMDAIDKNSFLKQSKEGLEMIQEFQKNMGDVMKSLEQVREKVGLREKTFKKAGNKLENLGKGIDKKAQKAENKVNELVDDVTKAVVGEGATRRVEQPAKPEEQWIELEDFKKPKIEPKEPDTFDVSKNSKELTRDGVKGKEVNKEVEQKVNKGVDPKAQEAGIAV